MGPGYIFPGHGRRKVRATCESGGTAVPGIDEHRFLAVSKEHVKMQIAIERTAKQRTGLHFLSILNESE